MEGETDESSAEVCCMIQGWDLKHLWKRVYTQAACQTHFAASLEADILSSQTELNSNFVTCKVCARFCCRLR